MEVGRDGGEARGWGLATAGRRRGGGGVMDESLQALATLPGLPTIARAAWPASAGCTPPSFS